MGGCSLWNIPKFDNEEYDKINHIRTISQLGEESCLDNEKMKNISYDIWLNAYEFSNYEEYISNNSELYHISKKLLILTNELYYKYKNEGPSYQYCKLKLDIIENSAIIIQKTLGNKPK